jgi:Flp pilus assembly protein TadB
MQLEPEPPSASELADQAGSLGVGLSTLVFQLFPLAVPLLALVVAPMAVLALVGLLLTAPLLLPVLLWRWLRGRPRSARGRSAPKALPEPL